jgi:hypothetical protein
MGVLRQGGGEDELSIKAHRWCCLKFVSFQRKLFELFEVKASMLSSFLNFKLFLIHNLRKTFIL